MPITEEQVSEVIGQPVLGADGEKVGDVGQVYLDDETDRPEWVTEERLHVGTEQRETGKVRLRKHIVTEQKTVTVRCSVRRSGSSVSRSPTSTAARRWPAGT